ncbi:MAG: aldehyde dehydrogenase (NADP(+)) [Casimicrobiaceae bacterium]
MNESVTGAALIGASERQGGDSFTARNAATGQTLEPAFRESGADDVNAACELAHATQAAFADSSPMRRADFIEAVGAQVIALGDALIDRALLETGLPRARLESERARTVGQLGFMARRLREGDCFDATIDRALPARTPLPRPDLRRRHLAVGPVAVFGASNFPLAFSVAGGDTASAFAAGCPVVVKGHPAHPGTGELVARAIASAVRDAGFPEGVFSYLPGSGTALGAALVAHPHIRAVGFTGSRAAGLALMRIAAARPEPIPVFAEMSSINPVFLFPAAAARRSGDLARAYVASLTLGAGQFCTNPGVLFGVAGADLESFIEVAAAALAAVPAQTMLTDGIATAYGRGVLQLQRVGGVEVVARGAADETLRRCRALLTRVDADRFLREPRLAEEVFGASSLIVRAASTDEFATLVENIEGQLTATVLYDPDDVPAVAKMLPALERRVGRIIGNGWPTGVEVASAMVHGGPYPATSDGCSTSVGSLAIQRFLRPVCYQDLAETLLPSVLKDANPWNVPRRVDDAMPLP